ncbi:histidine kinase [Actinomadura rubrisoli]|uniref:histidine kinase n=1 Tax=Actinomadura rubrisoli TaxID=2530368 RepID=A0A4R5BIK7_9ACTN|nr:histidine kinase [Actinomadura rubrisoli]TDD86391.1 hypothetical protein E1298_17585 [Actinomadura rubrisoli]
MLDHGTALDGRAAGAARPRPGDDGDRTVRDGAFLAKGTSMGPKPAKTVLPGLVLGLSALGENELWGDAGLEPWQLILTAVPVGAALYLCRRIPTVSFFAVAVVIMAQPLSTPALTTPILLSYLAVLAIMAYHAGYTGVARRASWRLPVILTAATVVGSGVVAVLTGGPNGWGFGLTMLALFGLVPALLGRDRSRQRELVRSGRNQVARLEWEQRIIARQTRLRERARIAQDMHDSLGHELSLIALRVGALEVAPDLKERQRGVFGELRSAVTAATERLTEIVGVLGDDTEPPAEDPAQRDIRRLVERARDSGMEIDLRVTGEQHRPPAMIENAIYRVLQEALTNAVKHAPGAPVQVVLDHRETESVVTVRNDRPATARDLRRGGGQRGLTGLRERIRLLGGTLDAGARDGVHQIKARLPHGRGAETGETS